MKTLMKIVICLVCLCAGCSFEKLNFSVDKGLLDPTSADVNKAKALPTLVH